MIEYRFFLIYFCYHESLKEEFTHQISLIDTTLLTYSEEVVEEEFEYQR